MAPTWTDKAIDHIRSLFPTLSLQSHEASAPIYHIAKAPFPHLIHSNIEPNEEEISVVLEYIHHAKAEEFRLRELLPMIDLSQWGGKGEQNAIERNLRDVEKFIRKHEAILSPWRRNVPFDLLALIFDLVHPRVWQERNRGKARKKGPPWAVSQVCQRWRDAALSSANLWTELPSINLSRPYSYDSSYLKFLEELLIRSRQAPIYLHLTDLPSARVGILEEHPVTNRLVQHSARWRTLEVDALSEYRPLFNAIRRATGHLSALVSLKITLRLTFRSHAYLPEDIIQPFTAAIQLRNIEFKGVHIDQVFLPYDQLISLSIRRCDEVLFYKNLPFCSHLQVLDISIQDIAQPSYLFNPPMIHLPHLKSFRITSSALVDRLIISGFMDKLTIPNIEELHVGPGEPRAFHVISSLLSRSDSPCLLKLLHVGPSLQTNVELINLLMLMPLIVYINVPLPPSPDDDTVFQAIKDTPSLAHLLQDSVFRRGNYTYNYKKPPFPVLPDIGTENR